MFHILQNKSIHNFFPFNFAKRKQYQSRLKQTLTVALGKMVKTADISNLAVTLERSKLLTASRQSQCSTAPQSPQSLDFFRFFRSVLSFFLRQVAVVSLAEPEKSSRTAREYLTFESDLSIYMFMCVWICAFSVWRCLCHVGTNWLHPSFPEASD